MAASSLTGFCKNLFFGRARSLTDHNLFHKLSLIAVFAWVGLGADGLSSSCYGPEETFKTLGATPHLTIFVAFASMVTIAALCASYTQIIALFPGGGGGYLVASKLLSPRAGVVSGSALLIDYVLTIAISVASGTDAIFSLLPPEWQHGKLAFGLLSLTALTVLNLRGVRESVMVLVPVFFVFVGSHAFAIAYALATHASGLGEVAASTAGEIRQVSSELGLVGLGGLLLRAYSMGAGTYTGIEAVSNGLPILREPRVETGRRTMIYMGTSLAVTAGGLLVAYLLFHVQPVEGKTLNAVLFERMTGEWSPGWGKTFLWVTLASEAALLLIAAQAGFIDGPRVAANLAIDRWLPTRFSHLSDRFVTQNGILLMGGAAAVMIIATHGAVATLVVLYSINVFITFSLSQLGMVRHWWKSRPTEAAWHRKLAINGFGLVLTLFILISITVVKFAEGGWITLVITGAFTAAAFAVRRHYTQISHQLRRLDIIVDATPVAAMPRVELQPDPQQRTAVILVNGFNGMGLHTTLHVQKTFGDSFRNYVFLSVGAVDAGNFKGTAELEALKAHTRSEAERYVAWCREHGKPAVALTAIGHDIEAEILQLAKRVAEQFPRHVFFAGQLLFNRETRLTRLLHNHTAFALQRNFFLAQLPFVVFPIRVAAAPAPATPSATSDAAGDATSTLLFRTAFIVLVVTTLIALFWNLGQHEVPRPHERTPPSASDVSSRPSH